MCTATLAVGERDAMEGFIVGHWYDECLFTGITQIGRGALEAFVPCGQIINASLDVIATTQNIQQELVSYPSGRGNYNRPYPDPKYSFPFLFLHLV
ncbi:hypothetical protein [Candidatus Rhabdochlamydia porcellionis]|jgi:hypothetical protein|uniref:Uncharacterized protein n=1 Tax=Candidatus Rhabdochlamydia porcellionis TaxID=225148 RepID=A0ABX8Z434_9BACT|nr:hypothetical protein [Candidatus Rhabdochlamydia porcellionis]QZA58837.1 hypothetical protein RHAB15C_0000716 [Candidatus Rhabdochlamydia porcellionis]